MPGVGRGRRSQPFTALPEMWYDPGLSHRGIEVIAGLLGYSVAQVTSWREVQRLGRAVRRRLPAGRARIGAVDETWLRVRGKARPVGGGSGPGRASTMGNGFRNWQCMALMQRTLGRWKVRLKPDLPRKLLRLAAHLQER